jgi:PAS domain-containing protein
MGRSRLAAQAGFEARGRLAMPSMDRKTENASGRAVESGNILERQTMSPLCVPEAVGLDTEPGFGTAAVADEQEIDYRRAFLSTVAPLRSDRRLAATIALLSLLAFVAVAPFAKVQLPVVPAFIPSYESALLINDLITAILLFGQFGILRSRALLVLAGGYLFSALMAVPHALTYPGVFAPQGLLGAGPQTTSWLYICWHIVFPLVVIAYALLPRHGVIAAAASARTPMIGAALTVVVAVVGLTLIAILAEPVLPAILSGIHYTPTAIFSLIFCGAISLLSLVVLFARRPHSLLDLWLMVVMCAWLFDVGLSAALNNGRYDLGFYAGRIFVLAGASFVLAVMLVETTRLYSLLAGAARRVTDYAAALGTSVHERTIELQRSNEALGESERRFQDIAEVSGDWIWETDSDHRFTVLVGQRTDALPVRPVSVFGKTRWEAAGADPETDAAWADHRADLEAHRPFRNFRYEIHSPDGASMFVATSGKPVFNAAQKFLGYRGTSTDETIIVEARRRAEEAEALLQDAIESISGGFLICDAEDRLVLFNQRFHESFDVCADILRPGVRYEDFLREAVYRGCYPRAAGCEGAWFTERLAQHREASTEIAVLLRGDRWALVTERRMTNGGTAMVSTDITALKAAQKALTER